jgi:hypothetical protein
VVRRIQRRVDDQRALWRLGLQYSDGGIGIVVAAFFKHDLELGAQIVGVGFALLDKRKERRFFVECENQLCVGNAEGFKTGGLRLTWVKLAGFYMVKGIFAYQEPLDTHDIRRMEDDEVSVGQQVQRMADLLGTAQSVEDDYATRLGRVERDSAWLIPPGNRLP